MPQITVKNIYEGGIADSDFVGAPNSVAEAVGLDIHSEVGMIKVNQKLTKNSGSTVDDFVKAAVSCSDGNSYYFGSTNGKIFSRSSIGAWAVEGTAAPAAGAVGILAAKEYQGYIYYAMQSQLGRWQLGTAWSTRNDSFATFTKTDATYHPMRIVNLVLYIGDGNLIAQVDAGTFSANALDIAAPLRVSSLGTTGTDLLIGTYINSNVGRTELINWNTWSVSFSTSDPIPEVGINAFLDMDNFVLVNAGTKGNLYLYNGSQLEQYKRIKGDWSGTNKAIVYADATLNWNGLPLFALSKSSGIGVNLGVYSMGRANRNYPYVLNLEYVPSPNVLTNMEIGSIISLGDVFAVSWKDTTSSATYGVDILDVSNKYGSAYFITRVMSFPDRQSKTSLGHAYVPYRTIPTSTDITIARKVNGAAYVNFASVTDSDRLVKDSDSSVGEVNTAQIKVSLTASANTAPEIEGLIVNIPSQGAPEDI